jgi:FMN phosphatase YigB (HAD superfamily)
VRFTDYQALSFDCYGTLINWEADIAAMISYTEDRRSDTPRSGLGPP